MDTDARARLGIEVNDWFNGKLGKYVLERANDEVEEASAELLNVSPTDSVGIEVLQTKAAQARLAIIWLNEAIADGDVAYRELKEDEIND